MPVSTLVRITGLGRIILKPAQNLEKAAANKEIRPWIPAAKKPKPTRVDLYRLWESLSKEEKKVDQPARG